MDHPLRDVSKDSPRLARIAAAVGVAVAIVTTTALAVAQNGGERVIKITAARYEYSPGRVVLKKGEPVILELISRDRLHGFHVKALNVRADVLPGRSVRIRVVPGKVGVFPFTCDLFCGSGHGDMNGVIAVTE